MAEDFSEKDFATFISLSRKAIAYYLHTQTVLKEESPQECYEKKLGVFVTLHSFPSMRLRGCIGFPFPVMQLWNAIIEAATSAAFADPRFSELTAQELEKIIIEISVLTAPEEIEWKKNPEELIEKIVIGKDGLIIKKGNCSGLLLPQVAPEQKWNALELLEQTCCKAGLPKESWKEKNTIVQKFSAQIFKEKKPNAKELIEG